MTVGRKPLDPSNDGRSFEEVAFDLLTRAHRPLSTHEIAHLLRLLGYRPHNVTATLKASKRIHRLVYASPDGHSRLYHWYARTSLNQETDAP